MGWSFIQGLGKQEFIDKLIVSEVGDTYKWEVLKHALKGNTLWTINKRTHLKTNESISYITCNLIEYDKSDNSYGYKDISEDSHPYYYDCPISFLTLCPPLTSEGSIAWRKEVRKQYNAKVKPSQLKVGMKLKLVETVTLPNKEVTVISVKPLRIVTDNGGIFACPRKLIESIL